MIKLKDILNEEIILVRRVDSKAVETFLKKYPKVKQIMTTLAQKNTDLMRGYKAFLKFKDKQEDYFAGRPEQTTSTTFGSKVFYKYDWNNLKGHWPEVYQYIYTLRYGGLDGAKVESVNEGIGKEAMGIAGFTGTRGIAVQKFIDDFNLNAKKLFNFIAKGKLKDRMDFATAISGKPGNKYQGNFVGMFGESKVTEATLTEKKYYVTYNKGRGQGKDLEKEFDQKTFSSTNKPKVFNSYNDAKKYAEKMEKMFRNSIGGGTAYWVSDEKMNPIKEASHSDTYFNTFTDAAEFARKTAEKKGFEIDTNDWHSQVTMGGRYSRARPSVGKTTTFTVNLLKNNKPTKKYLHFQVYGMQSGKFELNNYIGS